MKDELTVEQLTNLVETLKRTLGTLIEWMPQSANSPISRHEAQVLLDMLEDR